MSAASTVNLPRSDRSFRALLEYAGDAIVVCDARGRIVIANEETERLFGFTRDELLGEPIEVLLPHAARERHVAHRDDFMETHARRPMGAHLALHGRRRDGSSFPIEVSLGPLEEDGERLVAAIVRDVSERIRLEHELRRLADRDELTGLFNRRRFTLELDRLIASEEQDDAALLLIDLDNFKYVNDTLGHNAGDGVIRAAAEPPAAARARRRRAGAARRRRVRRAAAGQQPARRGAAGGADRDRLRARPERHRRAGHRLGRRDDLSAGATGS